MILLGSNGLYQQIVYVNGTPKVLEAYNLDSLTSVTVERLLLDESVPPAIMADTCDPCSPVYIGYTPKVAASAPLMNCCGRPWRLTNLRNRDYLIEDGAYRVSLNGPAAGTAIIAINPYSGVPKECGCEEPEDDPVYAGEVLPGTFQAGVYIGADYVIGFCNKVMTCRIPAANLIGQIQLEQIAGLHDFINQLISQAQILPTQIVGLLQFVADGICNSAPLRNQLADCMTDRVLNNILTDINRMNLLVNALQTQTGWINAAQVVPSICSDADSQVDLAACITDDIVAAIVNNPSYLSQILAGTLTSVSVAPNEALVGSGTPGDPLRIDEQYLCNQLNALGCIVAAGALSSVAHDGLLTGNGTAGSPLSINVANLCSALVASNCLPPSGLQPTGQGAVGLIVPICPFTTVGQVYAGALGPTNAGSFRFVTATETGSMVFDAAGVGTTTIEDISTRTAVMQAAASNINSTGASTEIMAFFSSDGNTLYGFAQTVCGPTIGGGSE